MTDPEDKPSFLARLAVVVTVGVIGWQIYWAGLVSLTGRWGSLDALTVLILMPGLSLLGVAGIYYLFKGKPTNADEFIAEELTSAWSISLGLGAIYCFFI